MNKTFFIILPMFIILFSFFVYAQHFWRGETMPTRTIQKMWGKSDFSAEVFKSAAPEVRAKMAYSLIKSKKYIGKSALKVRDELGSTDGYYFSDIYPAYIINEPQKKGDDVWQIVFLLKNDRTISDVIVHKNCCY